uniref:Uncharacterized protein n=1 Tax=Micrurus corallinus TaxID=54390 RepID=A0A2D4GXH0_MICCO
MYLVLNLLLDSSSLSSYSMKAIEFLSLLNDLLKWYLMSLTGALFFKAVFAGVLDGIIIKKKERELLLSCLSSKRNRIVGYVLHYILQRCISVGCMCMNEPISKLCQDKEWHSSLLMKRGISSRGIMGKLCYAYTDTLKRYDLNKEKIIKRNLIFFSLLKRKS